MSKSAIRARMIWVRVALAFLLLIVITVNAQLRSGYEPISLTVGAIIEKNDVIQEIAFKKSVQEANKLLQKHDSQRRGFQLVPVIETIVGDDAFEASRKACQLLERQAIAIYGPLSQNAVASVQSVTSEFGIPNLQIDWGFHESTNGLGLNVHPYYQVFDQAILDYVRESEYWKTIALIYQNENDLHKYSHLLRVVEKPLILRKWESSKDSHKYVIKHFKTSQTHYRFIVDLPPWEILEFLTLADSYNMTSQYYSFLFTDWDINLVDVATFNTVRGANITAVSVIQHINEPSGYGIHALLDDIHMEALQDERFSRSTWKGRIRPTHSALLYDAMSLLALGILSSSRTADITPPTGLTCSSSRIWSPGLALINDIKSIKPENFHGLTGTFQFDKQGRRNNVKLLFMEIGLNGFQQYGYWNHESGLVVTKNFSLTRQEIQSELKGKVLRITTMEEKPYVMYKGPNIPGQPKSSDPKHWEGFCISLLNDISEELNFTYTITLVADSTYGNAKIVDGVEVWDGIVEELRTRKADLAVGSFTITYDRERVIDFTTPFMYLGISIIYKRPEDKQSDLFSFLEPLSAPVWGYILAATIMVSFVLFVVARFSPYEWKVKHPCNVGSNTVENSFNVLNSFWFTFGSLMQKGSDVLPHATSTRIIAGFWWFFTLIVISSYTANLAAFLTVARMVVPIENAEDLAKQTKIKYGTIQGGSTAAFFEHSNFTTYKQMWKFMSSQKGLMMNNTPNAIERVKREEYAFILESTMNEYYTQRDCDLMQVGGQLDSKGYGIGLPEGSKYRDPISETILKLQKLQKIDKLKFYWWRQHEVGVSCDKLLGKGSDTSSLGVEKVGGCFVMLLIGMGTSMVVSFMEFSWYVYHKVKSDKKRSLSEEMARTFRFTLAYASIRSQATEEATQLPQLSSVHCCPHSVDGDEQGNQAGTRKCGCGNGSMSTVLAYAPCLPPPKPVHSTGMLKPTGTRAAVDEEFQDCMDTRQPVEGQASLPGMPGIFMLPGERTPVVLDTVVKEYPGQMMQPPQMGFQHLIEQPEYVRKPPPATIDPVGMHEEWRVGPAPTFSIGTDFFPSHPPQLNSSAESESSEDNLFLEDCGEPQLKKVSC